jgi:hypothetical protein
MYFSTVIFLVLLLSEIFAQNGPGGDYRLSAEQKKVFLNHLGISNGAPRPRNRRSEVVIPQSMIDRYEKEIGLKLERTNFQLEVGALTEPENAAVYEKCSLINEKKSGLINTKTVVECDFQNEGGYDLHEAHLRVCINIGNSRILCNLINFNRFQVYWKPHLAIERSIGNFRARASDLIRYKKSEGLQIAILLDLKKINNTNAAKDEGWYEFDVTGAVARWIRKRPKTTRLLLEKVPMKLSSKAKAELGSRANVTIVPLGLFEKPNLIIYSKSKVEPRRSRRESGARNSGKRNKRKKEKNVACRRISMEVNMRDMGWGDWILAPARYNAYRCEGSCDFPLPTHLNPTNHGTVQTIVSSINPSIVKKACCAPTKYEKLNILFLNENQKVTLKKYDEMIIVECGCGGGAE